MMMTLTGLFSFLFSSCSEENNTVLNQLNNTNWEVKKVTKRKVNRLKTEDVTVNFKKFTYQILNDQITIYNSETSEIFEGKINQNTELLYLVDGNFMTVEKLELNLNSNLGNQKNEVWEGISIRKNEFKFQLLEEEYYFLITLEKI